MKVIPLSGGLVLSLSETNLYRLVKVLLLLGNWMWGSGGGSGGDTYKETLQTELLTQRKFGQIKFLFSLVSKFLKVDINKVDVFYI